MSSINYLECRICTSIYRTVPIEACERYQKIRQKEEMYKDFIKTAFSLQISIRYAQAGGPLVFHRDDCCEYKISCINFRIFESISRKSENYDLSVLFFVDSAELWPRKNCSRRNADRCAFPLQFVTSFRTDFVQFIVEDGKDICAR